MAARPSAGHGPRQYDTVLLRLDPDWAGDLPNLLDELARSVQEHGEVDGSVAGGDHGVLYGADGSSLASTVRKVLARLEPEVAASVSVRPAHGD